MLTPADVTSAYRLILGREPESSTIVENFVTHSNFDALRKELLSSGEFAERLSRDPDLLALPMVVLMMSNEVRRYKRSVEIFASLGLSIQDLSVLLIGDELAPLADYFLDRRCRVGISASPHMTRLLEIGTSVQRTNAANTTLMACNFSEAEVAIPSRYDLLYGELPEDNSEMMRTWLDNTADACTKTMVLLCKTAPGRSEDVFVTRALGEQPSLRTIATKPWMTARLRERFEHVYEPLHIAYRSAQGDTANGETSSVFVATREALKLPTLQECQNASRSPIRRQPTGS